MRWKALICLTIVLTLVFASTVNATVYIPTTVYFLVDGEYKHFSEGHTFTRVQRISGVWYFDGATFDEIETPSYIPPIPPVIVAYANQTLYFRGTSHTVNNITAFELGDSPSDSLQTLTDTHVGVSNVSYGFRLYRARSNSALEEITSGTTTLFTLNTSTTGLQSGNWNAPETTLQLGFDALEITIYQRFGAGSWTAKATYITDGIMSKKILAQTWSFKLYIAVTIGATTTSTYRFGDNTYPSYLTGAAFKVPLIQDIQAYYWQVGDIIKALFYGYYALFGEPMFFGILLFMGCSTMYVKYRNFGPILVFFILFGGVGGLVWALVPAPANFVVWVFLLFGLGGLIFKVIR